VKNDATAPAVRSVAFIRGVMVGRQGLTRDVLLRAFRDAGADEPVSHLATGNVSFGYAGSTVALQRSLEEAIASIVGHREPVFVRSVAALRREIAKDPFADPPFDDVYERCVSFIDVSAKALALPMTSPRGDAVVFAARSREVFSVTRKVDGRPGSPMLLIERALGRRVSTRNWNTIERIVRKHESS
jgi:uncharacterized protein (DUF1697 family)